MYQSVKSALKKKHHNIGGASLKRMVRKKLFDVVKFKQRPARHEGTNHVAMLGKEERYNLSIYKMHYKVDYFI